MVVPWRLRLRELYAKMVPGTSASCLSNFMRKRCRVYRVSPRKLQIPRKFTREAPEQFYT